jgi:hypothetical protein
MPHACNGGIRQTILVEDVPNDGKSPVRLGASIPIVARPPRVSKSHSAKALAAPTPTATRARTDCS